MIHRRLPDCRPDHRYPVGAATVMALAGACTFARAEAEPFIGQFELKTLESEPGDYEFQSQNAWSWGQPSRRIARDGAEFEMDENSVTRQRHALELEIGFTRRLKTRIGIEFERERLDEPALLEQANDFGDLELSEVGAEIIAILVPRDSDGAGVGLVAEVELPTDSEESNHLILGPIVEFQSGPWFAAAIPMLVHAFGGDAEEGSEVDNKWDFAYATQLRYRFSATWALALEGYGTVERLGSSGHPSESAQRFGDFNQHRAGPVLYYTYEIDGPRAIDGPNPVSGLRAEADEEGKRLTVGLGMLEGLNGNTSDRTLKLSIELQF